MTLNENKNPIDTLMDKLRSLFGTGDHPKDKVVGPLKKGFNIWYFLIIMLFFSFLQTFFFSGKMETIPYSQFKQHIAEGKVGEISIGPDNINGTMVGSQGQKFTTVRVDDPGLVKELDERQINYSGWYENKLLSTLLSWIIPLGLFFLIWRFSMKKMGSGMGVMSFSKSKAKIFAESDTKVSFADVAGIDEAQEELREVVEFLSTPQKFQKLGGENPQRRAAGRPAGDRQNPSGQGPWPERPRYLSSPSVVPSL